MHIDQYFQGIEIRVVPKTNFSKLGYDISHKKLGSWTETLNKFYLFDFIEYDLLFFLDADMLVKSNKIDTLFNYCKKGFAGWYGTCYTPSGSERITASGCFIVKPVKGLFAELLRHGIQDDLDNDDVVLTKLFPNFRNDIESHLPGTWSDFVYHDGWTTKYPKYWTWVHIDSSWFLSMSDEEFNNFIFGLEAIGKGFQKFLYQHKIVGKEIFEVYEHPIKDFN